MLVDVAPLLTLRHLGVAATFTIVCEYVYLAHIVWRRRQMWPQSVRALLIAFFATAAFTKGELLFRYAVRAPLVMHHGHLVHPNTITSWHWLGSLMLEATLGALFVARMETERTRIGVGPNQELPS